MRLLAFAAVAAALLLAGCAGSHRAQDGAGTDPSLPGVRIWGNATWDGDSWVVTADAANQGPQTYRIDAGCDSPFGLEAHADKGEPFVEVQCLAYTEPIPFRPGDRAHRGWMVPAEELGWSGQAHFTVSFQDAGGVGRIELELS